MSKNVANVYDDFWTKAHSIITKSGQGTIYPGKLTYIAPKEKRKDGGDGLTYVRLKEKIYFCGWKWSYKDAKPIDIVVDSEFGYNPKHPMVACHSTTDVTYLELSGKRNNDAKLLERIRFDYHPAQVVSSKPDHPLFHMQFDTELPELPQELRGHRTVDDAHAIRRKDDIRVPTARICLPSAIILLVADHMGGEVLAEVLSQTKDIRSELESPCVDWFTNLHDLGHDVAGWGWYCESPKPREEVVKKGKPSKARA